MIHHTKNVCCGRRFLRGRRLRLAPSPSSLRDATLPLLSPSVTSSPGAGEVGPQGDAFELCRKPSRHRQKPSPWGRWHRAAMTEGVSSVSISMFCTNSAFSPCEKCEKSLSIKGILYEDATKIYLNKESAPCSRRQKAVFFKQTGQRPAQRDKSDNTM